MGGTYINPFTDFGFKKLFGEEANVNRDDQRAYQDSLKYYRDMKNSLDTMYEEGLEEGIQQGIERGLEEGRQQGLEEGRQQGLEQARQQLMAELARTMRARKLSDEIIISLTGLTQAQLDAL